MPWNEHQAVFLRELGVRWARGIKPPQDTGPVAEDRSPPSTASAGSPLPTTGPAAAPLVANVRAHGGPTSATPQAQPSATAAQRAATPALDGLGWDDLRKTVEGCQACGLCGSRTQTVFGVGSIRSQWMVVGEAPGEQEDLQGEPFVGAAGRLLDQMLHALRLTRAEPADGTVIEPARQVYIANTLKCRPPGNRNPQPEELQQCEPYLQRQLALLQPRIILAMGRFAVQSLLRSSEPIGKLRGRVHRYQGVPLVVTYHPAYLLRNPLDKAKAWADLCLAADTLDQQTATSPPARDA
jgi:uracil-DNA glycosylase